MVLRVLVLLTLPVASEIVISIFELLLLLVKPFGFFV
jgi:hypothetical protein